ncbi:unnamed protein product [Oikopleura dioica]|uniref:Uncharacterized protein n=1 Tax=Oikopleura dioica TaxID=34765 RepID=E4X011_OIKDI|nr:unnamed protein product [Oikopleura dioica]
MIELPCSTNSKMMLAPAADKLGLIWNTQSAVWLQNAFEHFAVSTAGRIVKLDVSWSSSSPPGKETFRKIHQEESITIDFEPLTTPGLAAIASDVKLFGVMPLNCDSNVDAFYAVTNDKFMLLTFTNTSDSTWTSELLDQTALHQEFFLNSGFSGDPTASGFKDFYINKKCEISVMEFPLGLKATVQN